MSFGERQQQFRAFVTEHERTRSDAKVAENFGFSNSARIIESGLFACTNNLEAYSKKVGADPTSGAGQFVFLCVLTFPPNDEVFFAIVVNDAEAVDKGLVKLARVVERRNEDRVAEGKKGKRPVTPVWCRESANATLGAAQRSAKAATRRGE